MYVVGALAPLASLLRFACIRAHIARTANWRAPDVFFSTASVALDESIKAWTAVECAAAICAFCLPGLRRLLRGPRPARAASEERLVAVPVGGGGAD